VKLPLLPVMEGSSRPMLPLAINAVPAMASNPSTNDFLMVREVADARLSKPGCSVNHILKRLTDPEALDSWIGCSAPGVGVI